MSDNVPQVSIVIVTHDSLPALADCLQALREAVESMSCELILVDNSSADNSISEAQRWFPEVRILRNDRNRGFAAACNQGAATSRGEYLFFLNPDVVIDPGAIGSLLAAGQSQSNAGLVSGRLRNTDGSFQATCRNFPTVGNMIFSRSSAPGRLFKRNGAASGRYTLPDYGRTTEVPAVAATMVVVRRDLFEQTGGFDSRFFLYMEDTDLSLRLHQNGRVNLLVPDAGGVHRWGEGSRAGRLQRLFRHHVSVWRYFLKHFPNGFSVVLLPLLLTVNFIWFAMLPKGKRGGLSS